MNVLVFVEGRTEANCIPAILQGYYKQGHTFKCRKCNGSEDVFTKLDAEIESPSTKADLLLGLLDGDVFRKNYDFDEFIEALAKIKQNQLAKFSDNRVLIHFAVHHIEAWLLCQPELFPKAVQSSIKKITEPEREISPSDKLQELYRVNCNREYRKSVDSVNLLKKLDLRKAGCKCPHLQALLDNLDEKLGLKPQSQT